MAGPTPQGSSKAINSTLSLSINVPTYAQSNNGALMILFGYAQGSGSAPSITTPSGWLLLSSKSTNGGGLYANSYVFYRYSSSEPTSYSVSRSSGVIDAMMSLVMTVYSGTATSGNPFDVYGWTTGTSGTSLSMTGITTTANNEYLTGFTGLSGSSASSFTVPAGWTSEESGNGSNTYYLSFEFADEAFPSAGSTGTITFTASNGGNAWIGFLGAIKASAPPGYSVSVKIPISASMSGSKSLSLTESQTVQIHASLSTSKSDSLSKSVTENINASMGGDRSLAYSKSLTQNINASVKGERSLSYSKAIVQAIGASIAISRSLSLSKQIIQTINASITGISFSRLVKMFSVLIDIAASVSISHTSSISKSATIQSDPSVSGSRALSLSKSATITADPSVSVSTQRSLLKSIVQTITGFVTGSWSRILPPVKSGPWVATFAERTLKANAFEPRSMNVDFRERNLYSEFQERSLTANYPARIMTATFKGPN